MSLICVYTYKLKVKKKYKDTLNANLVQTKRHFYSLLISQKIQRKAVMHNRKIIKRDNFY